MTSIENHNLQFRPDQHVPHSANNLHTIPYLQNRVNYIHQIFFCPPYSTLLVAINNHQIKGCPFMTADNVHKYLRRTSDRVHSGQCRTIHCRRKLCQQKGNSKIELTSEPRHSPGLTGRGGLIIRTSL